MTAPLVILDEFGMRELSQTTAEELIELYERASTLVTSNESVGHWASCWRMLPRSARCSTAPFTTATC